MYHLNYPYDPRTNLDYTIEELIRRLFQKTTEQGDLILPEIPYQTRASLLGKEWRNYHLTWNEEDLPSLIEELETLDQHLQAIAEVFPELGFTRSENRELLSPELLKTWDKYLKDLNDGMLEKELERTADRLIFQQHRPQESIPNAAKKNRRFEVDPYPPGEEMLTYWSRIQDIRQECDRRLGKNRFSFDVQIRAKRLFYCYAFEGPNALIRQERRLLVEAFILQRFCDRVGNTFEVYSGYGFPLKNVKNVRLIEDILLDEVYSQYEPDEAEWMLIWDWEKQNETGEQLLHAFNRYNDFDEDSVVWLLNYLYRNKTYNPNHVEFNVAWSEEVPMDATDYILLEDEPYKPFDPPLSDEDKIALLKAAARDLGVDESLVQHYEIHFD